MTSADTRPLVAFLLKNLNIGGVQKNLLRRATSVLAPPRAVVANHPRVNRASQTIRACDIGVSRRPFPASGATGAKQRFVTAVRRAMNLLRLRPRWAAYGRILQQQPRCDLWVGLERRS